MRYKTKGIVLNYIRYSESSVIIKVYTEIFGLQSYIVNNVRSVKPKYNIALFQPMTQLELIAYHNIHGKINRVAEIRISAPYSDIPFNIRKSTVTMFLSEILGKTLKEETSNSELFSFITSSFSEYDGLKDHYQNFHIQFLLRYLKYIGLDPVTFNSLCVENSQRSQYPVIEEDSLVSLVNEPYGSEKSYLVKVQRLDLLELITGFLAHNLGIDNNFKSLKVLKEVFE
jgi:DNA repair protein RecO (recombination protein O)